MQLLTMSGLRLMVAVFILVLSSIPSSEELLSTDIKLRDNSTALFEEVCGHDNDKLVNKKYDKLVSCFPQNDTVLVRKFSCVTASNKNHSSFVAGACPFSGRVTFGAYRLNLNSSTVNSSIFCKGMNRQGQLCGCCDNNSALAINSYSLQCMNASDCHWYHWPILLLVDLGPVTVFFIIVIVFHISITSGYANAYILFAQLMSLQINVIYLKDDWGAAVSENHHPPDKIAMSLIVAYSVWNLDLGRSILPSLCLGHSIGNVHAIAFQYIAALYGLVLIITVYVLVELHARNVRLIVWLWRPFGICFSRFQRQLDARASIIDAFATLLLLAYSKTALTSIILLTPTQLIDRDGKVIGYVLLYDGTIDYFGGKHFILAIVAIIVFMLFIALPPIALVLYPFKCVQKCLTRYRLNRPALVAFMDAFQGCYKDGTNGTRDLRFFSAAYMLLRVVVFTIFVTFARVDLYHHLQYCNLIISGAFTILIAILRPYKRSLYNNIDTAMFGFCTLVAGTSIYKSTLKRHKLTYEIIFLIMLSIPFFISVIYVLVRICAFIRVNRCVNWCVLKYGSPGRRSTLGRISGSYLRNFGSDQGPSTPSLPDRLLRPEEYDNNETSELNHTCGSKKYGALL